jgi:hypothetical protein
VETDIGKAKKTHICCAQLATPEVGDDVLLLNCNILGNSSDIKL